MDLEKLDKNLTEAAKLAMDGSEETKKAYMASVKSKLEELTTLMYKHKGFTKQQYKEVQQDTDKILHRIAKELGVNHER